MNRLSMNIRNKIKQLVRWLAKIPYIGRPISMVLAARAAYFTRKNQAKIALAQAKIALNQEQKLQAILDGYGAAIRGLENAVRRHELLLEKILKNIESVSGDDK